MIEKGAVSQSEAEQIFLEFPFEAEIAKRNENPDLMAPTITFHNEKNGFDLALWTEDSNTFELWFPPYMVGKSGLSKVDAVKFIMLFFNEDYERIV